MLGKNKVLLLERLPSAWVHFGNKLLVFLFYFTFKFKSTEKSALVCMFLHFFKLNNFGQHLKKTKQQTALMFCCTRLECYFCFFFFSFLRGNTVSTATMII